MKNPIRSSSSKNSINKAQEIRIKNNSWREYLIDRILLCSEKRKSLLKKYLKNNENYKQIQVYTDGSLQEKYKRVKKLGYAIVQIDENKNIICKIR